MWCQPFLHGIEMTYTRHARHPELLFILLISASPFTVHSPTAVSELLMQTQHFLLLPVKNIQLAKHEAAFLWRSHTKLIDRKRNDKRRCRQSELMDEERQAAPFCYVHACLFGCTHCKWTHQLFLCCISDKVAAPQVFAFVLKVDSIYMLF